MLVVLVVRLGFVPQSCPQEAPCCGRSVGSLDALLDGSGRCHSAARTKANDLRWTSARDVAKLAVEMLLRFAECSTTVTKRIT